MSTTSEKKQFQAEVQQLLQLMINSIYSNKEIFLRELISNSSDAIDKRKFESLTNQDLLPEGTALEVRLEPNKEPRQLTIHDNGLGMSRDELIANIGTIARSGTKEMLEKMKESNGDADLIGQFGVGFYSAFIVAEKVTLVTLRAGESVAYKWESTGDGSYTIEETQKEEPGTSITLHLKTADEENGLDDFTDQFTIENVVKKYSDFIHYPVVMNVSREEYEKDDEGNIKEDAKSTTVFEDKTLNSMKPIWTRTPSDVTDDEYKEFYKHISRDWQEPIHRIRYRAEGRIEYTALLYFPTKAPFDLFYQDYKSGLQLYVKKVMISEALEDLLPRYLRFIKGVVESPDLPLNISREMLQQDRHIALIRKGLTTKILNEFKSLLEKNRETFQKVWAEFGTALKEGASSDFENKEKLQDILLFESTADDSKLTTLSEYVDRMHPDQKEIYYLIGESRNVVENSPHLAPFKEKNYEVLLLTDPVDEYLMQNVNEYKEKKLASISKKDTNAFTEEEQKAKEKELKSAEKDFKTLLEVMQEALKDRVKEVTLSAGLVGAPARVVGEDFDMSPHLEKLLKRQGQDVPGARRILELNPDHSLVQSLKSLGKDDKETINSYGEVLLGYALIADGGDLPDPIAFNKELLSVLEKSLPAT